VLELQREAALRGGQRLAARCWPAGITSLPMPSPGMVAIE
jgi:hypothetical protein